jgi:hypothetical protein
MKFITAGALVLIAVAQLFTACCRRPLDYGEYNTALIPVNIDWSRSGVSTLTLHRATVMLFPEQGGMPLEYMLEGNVITRTIEVPVGVYSVVVFNETINDEWQGISFINTDDYENFSAVGRAVASRGFYTRSTDLPLTENPEPLAAWSLDRFEVTEELLARSRMSSRAALESEIDDLTHVVPTPRIERMKITADVRHLASSMQATGTIGGLASGVKMASGEKIGGQQTATHAFVLNNRKYDNDPDGRHGTTERTFNIFGHPQELSLKPMAIDFLLNDGTAFPTVSFNDVHSMIVRQTDPDFVTLNSINVSSELPEVGGDQSITVDDWDEVIIPL